MNETQPTESTQLLERPDDHQCVRAWTALRSVYERVNEALADELAGECGITLNDYDVLAYLQRTAPVRPRLGDLNDAVTLTQPSLSRLVMRLEQRGFLRRIDGDEDRRAVLVELTRSGRALIEKAIPIHASCVWNQLSSRMTTLEQESLVATFDRIQDE